MLRLERMSLIVVGNLQRNSELILLMVLAFVVALAILFRQCQ